MNTKRMKTKPVGKSGCARWRKASLQTMTAAERKRTAVRYDCMQWAVQQAAPGEDAVATVARAQLYADFVLQLPTLEGIGALSSVRLDGDQLPVHIRK